MEESDKEKLRELSTSLMGLSMKFDVWIDEIKKSKGTVDYMRNVIHNLVNKVKESDLND